jgi:FAD-dependent urate hydroxylase
LFKIYALIAPKNHSHYKENKALGDKHMHNFHIRYIAFLCFFLSFTSYGIGNQFCALAPFSYSNMTELPKQNRALIRDLKLINFPPVPWMISEQSDTQEPIYDVIIVGGGASGLTAGAALFKEGVFNIKIFDENLQGNEGPWATYARMKNLRSSKYFVGPALDIPHLTFHAWFEAQFGQEAWRELSSIPNHLWMNYLIWIREAMQLPVENDCKLINIIPDDSYLVLEFERAGVGTFFVHTRKVVLATGRAGCGGVPIPDLLREIPKTHYAHSTEIIDFAGLKNRRVCVLGAGSSAFDAAAVALENNAQQVDILMRRKTMPKNSGFGSLTYKGFVHGYYKLSDQMRWEFMRIAFAGGIPPPDTSIERVKSHKNFQILSELVIHKIELCGNSLLLTTNRGVIFYDYMIASTGFQIDVNQQPELKEIVDQIVLWKDRISPSTVKFTPFLGKFPYLGPSFEFLAKDSDAAPYMKNIHCFNYGATLSHGLLSSDIVGISAGATRLAQGIAADFFVQDGALYLENLKLIIKEK